MKTRLLLLATISTALAVVASAQTAESLYNEGLQLKKDKKSAEAIKKFEQALSLDPNYVAAMYDLGWCRNDVKDYAGALVTLRKARPFWWNIPRVHFELGYAFEKLAMYDSAIASYNQCLVYKADYTNVPKQLGYIAYTREDYVKAIEHFLKYETVMKDSITDYIYWYRKGFCYNATKVYANAIPALEKSARYKADYVNTYLELGFAHTKLKQDDNALAYFQKAIDLDPKSHVGYNGTAEVYRDNKKNMIEAMNWYKKSLAVVPGERKACFGIAYCLNNQGKYSEAIPYLKTAIEKEPTYTAAYTEIGYSYYMTSNNADAIINLNKAISLSPLNENSRYYLVLVYINKKEKTNAQKYVDELKKLNSKHVEKLQPKVDAL